MIEILDQLDILARPELDLSTLSLAGVHFGARAADAIPRDRVTQVTPANAIPYYGAVGQRPDGDAEIVDGTVHFAGQLSFKVAGGLVVGFTLYGEAQLDHFREIATYEDFLVRFGTPDRIEKREAFGDLLGYRNYYDRSRKQVYWDHKAGRLAQISLGAYEGTFPPLTAPNG